MTIPISRDNKLYHFGSYNIFENEAHFGVVCVGDKISSIFKHIVFKNLKSFFQLDHGVDIELYLSKATDSTTLRN